jgi:hypothetical protein
LVPDTEEERRLRVFENRTKRNEVKGEWKNFIIRILMIFIPHPPLCG